MKMIHIMTGAVNSGKTTRMKKLLQRVPGADGVLSEKAFEGDCFRGYCLTHAASGEWRELALLEEFYSCRFPVAGRLGPYVFSREAFRFAREILMRLAVDDGTRAIFIDEAGPLELRGEGFSDVIPLLLACEKDLYITVRSSCLEGFLTRFGITEHALLPLSERSDQFCLKNDRRVPESFGF